MQSINTDTSIESVFVCAVLQLKKLYKNVITYDKYIDVKSTDNDNGLKILFSFKFS